MSTPVSFNADFVSEVEEKSVNTSNTPNKSNTLAYIIVLLTIMGYFLSNFLQQRRWRNESLARKDEVEEEEEEEGPPEPLRNFTVKQLKKFNGTIPLNMKNVPNPLPSATYLSLNGLVFDVSKATEYYGPGSPYSIFAGRECGSALAKMLFDDQLCDQIESVKALNASEMDSLNDWIVKFRDIRRYPVIGRVVFDPPPVHSQVLTDVKLEPYRGLNGKKSGDLDLEKVMKGDDLKDFIPEIYVGVGEEVYDVSFGGVQFYGEGGGYALFAGRECSVSLAKMSFKPEELANKDLGTLTDKEKGVLRDWVKTFKVKKEYPVVGRTGLTFE